MNCKHLKSCEVIDVQLKDNACTWRPTSQFHIDTEACSYSNKYWCYHAENMQEWAESRTEQQ